MRCFTGGLSPGGTHRISDMQVDVNALEDAGLTERTVVIVTSTESDLDTDVATAAAALPTAPRRELCRRTPPEPNPAHDHGLGNSMGVADARER